MGQRGTDAPFNQIPFGRSEYQMATGEPGGRLCLGKFFQQQPINASGNRGRRQDKKRDDKADLQKCHITPFPGQPRLRGNFANRFTSAPSNNI